MSGKRRRSPFCGGPFLKPTGLGMNPPDAPLDQISTAWPATPRPVRSTIRPVSRPVFLSLIAKTDGALPAAVTSATGGLARRSGRL